MSLETHSDPSDRRTEPRRCVSVRVHLRPEGFAASVPGLKTRQLFGARNSTAVKNAAAAVSTDAKANNVTGTPSIFVGKSGQRPTYVTLSGGTDEATLVKALDAAPAG